MESLKKPNLHLQAAESFIQDLEVVSCIKVASIYTQDGFDFDILGLYKQKAQEKTIKESEKMQKIHHATIYAYAFKEEMQMVLNFHKQKLFSQILTAFSSKESTPSTATIWYCFSFRLPTNFRSSLRPLPSLFCFSSFCICWEEHPGSNSSKHKVLFFFSSIPTTVRLWPNIKIRSFSSLERHKSHLLPCNIQLIFRLRKALLKI